MSILLHTLAMLFLLAGLVILSYLDLIYRHICRVTTGRVRAHIDIFENEIEPRLKIERQRGTLTFSLLVNLWLLAVAAETAYSVIPTAADMRVAVIELVCFLTLEIVLGMHLAPAFLLARTTGRWLLPLAPLIRLFAWIAWPLEAGVAFVISLVRLSEQVDSDAKAANGERIEALVEVAQEEGLLEKEEARLIEQVVEFSDKRVRDVMTPRPDVVAIAAGSTIEELRRLLVLTKFSRIPVYEGSLDDIQGIVYARNILQIPEREAARRKVSELMRPALFVPETKLGSELLKEMQHKNQQMAIVIDEYGMLAGVVTVEDLVEEIVGEIGEEDRHPAPDVVRETPDSLVLRGSLPVEKLQELFGMELRHDSMPATVAGLLNSVAGHVPTAGETIEYDGLRFEVLEANQRKVLRLRARRLAAAPMRAPEAPHN